MRITIGHTAVVLTARAAGDIPARAIGRVFASLAELRAAPVGRGGTGVFVGAGRGVRPRFPGDVRVGAHPERSASFALDTCLAWEEAAALRGPVVHEALRRAGDGMVEEAGRFACRELAIAPLPDAPDPRELHAWFAALLAGLRGGLARPNRVEAIHLSVATREAALAAQRVLAGLPPETPAAAPAASARGSGSGAGSGVLSSVVVASEAAPAPGRAREDAAIVTPGVAAASYRAREGAAIVTPGAAPAPDRARGDSVIVTPGAAPAPDRVRGDSVIVTPGAAPAPDRARGDSAVVTPGAAPAPDRARRDTVLVTRGAAPAPGRARRDTVVVTPGAAPAPDRARRDSVVVTPGAAPAPGRARGDSVVVTPGAAPAPGRARGDAPPTLAQIPALKLASGSPASQAGRAESAPGPLAALAADAPITAPEVHRVRDPAGAHGSSPATSPAPVADRHTAEDASLRAPAPAPPPRPASPPTPSAASADAPTAVDIDLRGGRGGPPAPSWTPPTARRTEPTTAPTFRAIRPAQPATDDDLVSQLPHPLAYPWHLAVRRLNPEERLQSLLHAGETIVRAVCGVLLADYLRGPPDDAVVISVKRLTKGTFGDWSKAVDCLAEAVVSRAEPAPFLTGLPHWLANRDPAPWELAKAMVEQRNAMQHGRRALGRAAAQEAADTIEDLLRRYLRTLAWLADYDLVHVVDQALRPGPVFRGHWEFYRGREILPRPTAVSWRGDLLQDHVYLADLRGGRALDVYPFVHVAPDPTLGDDVLVCLERFAARGRAILCRPGAKLTSKVKLTQPVDDPVAANRPFWAGEQPRLVPITVFD